MRERHTRAQAHASFRRKPESSGAKRTRINYSTPTFARVTSIPATALPHKKEPPRGKGRLLARVGLWLSRFSSGYSLELSDCPDPRAGLALEVLAADESAGAELCSLAPRDLSTSPDSASASEDFGLALAAPDIGGAELCSLAPVELSAEPASGSVAAFAASCEVPDCVGGFSCCLDEESSCSAARAGVRPSRSAAVAVETRNRVMTTSSLYLRTNTHG